MSCKAPIQFVGASLVELVPCISYVVPLRSMKKAMSSFCRVSPSSSFVSMNANAPSLYESFVASEMLKAM